MRDMIETLKKYDNLEMNKSLQGFYKVSRFGVNLFIFNSFEMNDINFSKLANALNLKKYNINYYH